MRYQNPVDVPLSGNVWIDGLIDGYRWGISPSDRAVGYTFIGDTSEKPGGEFAGYRSWGWSDQERSLMQEAMAKIADITGLEFIDRGDDNDDEVEIWFYNLDNLSADDSYGFAFTPGSDPDEGLVAVNWSVYQNDDGSFKGSIESGSFYGITFLHELCHALGMKHPHDKGLRGQPRFPGLSRVSDQFKDSGDFGQNAHPWTQLSYVDKGARNGLVPSRMEAYGFLQTPGALDTAALQWMYGINEKTALGNDVYRLPTRNEEGTGWSCIWDAGGVDRIDGAGARAPLTIDLRNASLDLEEHAGGHVSRVEGVFGGFTIAHDWDGRSLQKAAGLSVIENASGGRGDDRLIGNDADNVLRGRRGDDILFAGAGRRNRAVGGKGRDQFWIDPQVDSFVKIKDFSRSKDLLVFDVDSEAVDLISRGRHTFVLIDDQRAAQICNVTDLSRERHLDFSGFEGF